MSVELQTKLVVTVAEMARMVGLSRARFYQLVGAAFPHPLYNVKTRRPFFNEEQQRVCLEVRRRNCGIDGTPILFYARRLPNSTTAPKSRRKTTPLAAPHAELLDALKELGLTSVTPAQVGAAVGELYPKGIAGADEGEVIRAIFLRLKRQDSSDNVGR
jgi:hypothetical protein